MVNTLIRIEHRHFPQPRGEVLVPALKSVVKKVDLEAGEMVLVAARLREVAVFDAD